MYMARTGGTGREGTKTRGRATVSAVAGTKMINMTIMTHITMGTTAPTLTPSFMILTGSCNLKRKNLLPLFFFFFLLTAPFCYC